MISNNARVARALYLLKLDLDNFVPREFTNHHQDQTGAVLNQILGQSRDSQKPFQNMKTQDLLAVVQASWWNVFDRAMGGIEPGLIREVTLTHESWAGRSHFSAESAFQALNSVQRLLSAMSSPSTLELDMLKRECLESEMEEEEVTVSSNRPTETAVSTAEGDATVDGQPATAADPQVEAVEADEEEVTASGEDPYAADLLRVLREAGALREGDLLARATRDGIQAQYADDSLIQDLNTALARALDEQGIQAILGYQGETLSNILAGSNVVLEAGWAADETATLAVVLAECLLRNPGCHGLVLSPDEDSVAPLAEHLNSLLSTTGVRAITVTEELPVPAPESEEPFPPAVLVASVDSLNSSLASLGGEWQSLLKDLKIVALYRAGEYRGRFGANVAVLLRRFVHRLAVLAANPQYLVLAQGCANGTELARNLTGKDFQVVAGPGNIVSMRHYIAVCPRDPEGPGQVDLPGRVARAALACVGTGRSVLVRCAGENLAQAAFATARAMREDSEIDEGALLLVEEDPHNPSGFAGGAGSKTQGPRAVFAVASQDIDTLPGNFDGVIVAGSLSSSRAALKLLDSAGGGEGESFALFYAANDIDGRFAVRNLETLLGKEPDQVVVDPDIAEIIRRHLPALVHEVEGRIYSFSREALGNTIFQALRRDAASLVVGDETDKPAVDLRPSGQPQWGLWLEGRQVSSLSPYGKFREIFQGSVIALDGRKYRVASVDPGEGDDRSPTIVLEGAEALSNLRTVPSFSTAVNVLEESLCLSVAPGVSLHLGRVAAEETLDNVSVIDDSGSPDPDYEALEGQDNQELVTATFAPDEEVTWSLTSQAFWIDVAGLTEGDASSAEEGPGPAGEPATAALEQMFRVGAKFSFPVGKYDLATYSQGSTNFIVEVSPESLGIVKKVFDHWRDILRLGAIVARNCRCTTGCIYCLLPVSPYDKPMDKAGGLALADRLLEIAAGS